MDKDHSIGTISVYPVGVGDPEGIPYTGWKSMISWRTDTTQVTYPGVGMGQFLYLAMAAKFFSSYPSKRLISYGHSTEARSMWERLVAKGYARKFKLSPTDDDSGYVFEIKKEALGRKLKAFVKEFKIELE